MPKYAVDFVAEIQELTSATNFDDYSDSVDLLTNLHLFNVPVERPSEENNVVNALMGNAQCCFKRYPGYQAHRHVVVSRGVQCSEAIIKKLVENDIDSAENNNLFRPHTTERGDIFNEHSLFKEDVKSPDNHSIVPLKASINPCRNGGVFKRKPEIFTPVTQEPPELRESSKFFRKHFPLDYKRHRKYFEDDIDSLSATISNYSLHEKLLKLEENVGFHKIFETVDQNNHKFENNTNMIPSFQQKDGDFKSSTEAIKGSMTRSLTGKSQIVNQAKRETHENPSSDSYTSLGNAKENRSTYMTNSGDITQETTPEKIDKRKQSSPANVTNFTIDKTPPVQQANTNLIQSFQLQPCQSNKQKSSSSSQEKNSGVENIPSLSDKLNKNNASSVTFMKGSEELKNYEQQKLLESNNLNALRKKQRFIMKHTRTNSRNNILNNSDAPPLITLDFHPQGQSEKIETPSSRCQQEAEILPAHIDLPVPVSPSRNNISNAPNFEPGRLTNLSRNSSHSENVCITPSQNTQKIKRSVSFDRSKQADKSFHDQIMNISEPSNQNCSRNTVRAKYCTKKVVKHKFYVPESANIEQILRDPSDRRIKAICDRHNCDIEIYSKVPKCGFLKNIIILAAPNNENLRKCVRSLDYSMHWCLTAQLT